ncbi:hypothetical protein JTE90_024136 [Oedothorax gibbosus]|uniref:Uncharacterized protein n=1 Tax=Oedothorax gibbosus TaxID=931172 RepID=A0AAV6U4R9_9ARAC|nr:hypothetical protein JTE90_024136 [Oedothorax gibbosus]
MLHRAGLCGVLLCWVVFVLSVSGSKKSAGYEVLYDCLHKHICDCNFGLEYQLCFYQLPKPIIDNFEKLAHQKFPEITNIRQSLDPVWNVLCKEPKEVFFPFFTEAYDDLIAYRKTLSRTVETRTEEQRLRELIKATNASLCAMPLVARCLETQNEGDCW